MKKIFLYLCVTLIILLTGCKKMNIALEKTDVKNSHQNMQAYLKTLHAQRIFNVVVEEDVLALFQDEPYDYATYMQDLRYVLDHSEEPLTPKLITSKVAVQDVEQLFSMLQTFYGGYPVYAKDVVESAKQSIIRKLHASSKLTLDEMAEIISNELSFFDDDHFRIENAPLQETYILYHEDVNIFEQSFTKDKDKYYRKGYDAPIQKINDSHDVEKYLKPVLQLDGSITYHIYVMDKKLRSQVPILFENGEQIEVELIEDVPFKHTEAMSDQEVNGIPYVYMGSMVYQKNSAQALETADAFLQTADTFKKNAYAVMDLRNNRGGNAMLSYAWSHRFTGVKRAGLGTRVLRMPLYDVQYTKVGDDETVQSLADLKAYANFQSVHEGLYVEKANDTLADNDTLLFVLQDRNSISAAEMLIDQLHTVKNVIFAGVPSRGAIASSAMIPFYMEHTGLKIQFGNLYGIFSDAYGNEYSGIEPDIWVPSQQVLDYVTTFIQNDQSLYKKVTAIH